MCGKPLLFLCFLSKPIASQHTYIVAVSGNIFTFFVSVCICVFVIAANPTKPPRIIHRSSVRTSPWGVACMGTAGGACGLLTAQYPCLSGLLLFSCTCTLFQFLLRLTNSTIPLSIRPCTLFLYLCTLIFTAAF